MSYEKRINHGGFTLNEIIVVTVILGTLISLAIPRFTSTSEAVKVGEGFQILQSLLQAQKSFNFETGAYADDKAKLDVVIPNSSNFDVGSIVIRLATPLASISRIGGTYTLSISDTGVITCTPITPGICNQIGCTGAGGTCN